MEKNCRRREGINQIGCMWVFISIFGSNQKRLLMDMKRGSRRFSGFCNFIIKLVLKKPFLLIFRYIRCTNNILQIYAGNYNEKKQLNCSCESSQEKLVDEDIDEHVVETEVCKNSVDESEEKFREIIKRLIAQKEGEIQTCKDLLEAFHVLDSREEPFLKKVSHEDAQSLVGDSKRVEEEEKPEAVLKQEAVVVSQKKGKFFSKKWRSSQERRAKTIVVLKPGPTSLDVDSSSGPRNKSKNGSRTFSRFLIGLIKRRLQAAVGKKSCDDKSQNCCLQEEIQSKKHVLDEEEEPFSNERRSNADKADTTDQTSEDSEKIMSGLYIAAKKHLSEMLANGDIDVSSPDKEVPRILGKILSLPEFSSPTDSPRLIPAHDLVSQTTVEPKIPQCGSAPNDLTDEEASDKHEETLFAIDISVPEGDFFSLICFFQCSVAFILF